MQHLNRISFALNIWKSCWSSRQMAKTLWYIQINNAFFSSPFSKKWRPNMATNEWICIFFCISDGLTHTSYLNWWYSMPYSMPFSIHSIKIHMVFHIKLDAEKEHGEKKVITQRTRTTLSEQSWLIQLWLVAVAAPAWY